MVLKLSRSGRTKETVSEKCNDSTNSGHEARGDFWEDLKGNKEFRAENSFKKGEVCPAYNCSAQEA